MSGEAEPQTPDLPIAARSGTGVLADWMLGGALIAAFSPGLFDLVGQWLGSPWSRYSLVFVPLLALGIRAGPACIPRIASGSLLLAVGLASQLLAAMGAVPALGRPAMAVGAIGFLLVRGICPPRTALLALWIIPVPNIVAALVGGEATAALLFGSITAGLASIGLAPPTWQGLIDGSGEFGLLPVYNGLPLLVMLVGLALFAAIRQKLELGATAGLVGWLALAGAGFHLAVVLLACLAIGQERIGIAKAVLENSWMIAAAAVIFWTERRGRQSMRTRAS